MASKQPAHRVLNYILPEGESYVDLANDLSKINRRLYRQGMQYAVQKVEFVFVANPQLVSSVSVNAFVAGDTWVVHNAWRKAQAHWLAQQRDARRLIGQSAKPTWEDFKVYLDDTHRSGTRLSVLSGDGAAVAAGEWDYSKFVWELDDNSILEPYCHLIGGDVGSPYSDVGLIEAYQESRATVQSEDPDLPADYSTNLYSYLAADENLSADEVAANMRDENDEPPYDQDAYPGADVNSDRPWSVETQAATGALPNATLDGFVSQCGLILFNCLSYDANGSAGAGVTPVVMVHLAPGGYKGVAAIPMGQ